MQLYDLRAAGNSPIHATCNMFYYCDCNMIYRSFRASFIISVLALFPVLLFVLCRQLGRHLILLVLLVVRVQGRAVRGAERALLALEGPDLQVDGVHVPLQVALARANRSARLADEGIWLLVLEPDKVKTCELWICKALR